MRLIEWIICTIYNLKILIVLDFIQMVYALYGKACYKKENYLVRRKKVGTELNIKEVDYIKTRFEYSFTTRSGYIVIRNCGIIYVMGDYKE